MFSTEVYAERRKMLKQLVNEGIIFFTGNNTFYFNELVPTHFKQDSSFLYYFGHNEQGLAGIIDIDNNKDILFGDDRTIDDEIWMGNCKKLAEKAEESGVDQAMNLDQLKNYVTDVLKAKRKIHYLPQQMFENKLMIEDFLGIKTNSVNDFCSMELINAVIAQRSVKADYEIAEIENALDISYAMNLLAMSYTKPGTIEKEIAGAVEGMALSLGRGISFPVIFTVNGQILHNHGHDNFMKEGQLALLDSGAFSYEGYSSDITRTFPVTGKFTDKQKDIYNIVLAANLKGIESSKPGVLNRDVHLAAAKVIAEGLIKLGLMKGDADEAVKAGAHALFFPHGLGHMMGLDVHDMEDIGENYVGYNNEIKRSTQFGLRFLRMARELEPGFVMTIEPGIYFIPNLIDKWQSENLHTAFINYDKVNEYRDFGGIRIEDDIVITHEGCRVLGQPIPKTVEEIENTMMGK